MSYGMVAATLVWAIMAIVLIVVPCNPAQYYTNPKECTNRVGLTILKVSTYTDRQSGRSGKRSVP
jgi:hypothetical protein